MFQITFPQAKNSEPKKKRPGMLLRFEPEIEAFIRREAKKKRMHVNHWVATAACLAGKDVKPGLTFKIEVADDQSRK